MRRQILAAALLACASGSALAQDQTPAAAAPAVDEDTARASHAMAAIWRPFVETPAGAAADFQTACAGAQEELEQVDAAVPEQISAESLSAIRAPHGLVIVPAGDEPRAVFVFANHQLGQITSGLGILRVADAAQAVVGISDARGQETFFQLGQAGGKAMMRVLRPNEPPLTYVGCAPTTG